LELLDLALLLDLADELLLDFGVLLEELDDTEELDFTLELDFGVLLEELDATEELDSEELEATEELDSAFLKMALYSASPLTLKARVFAL